MNHPKIFLSIKKENLQSNLLHIPTYKKLRKIELYLGIDKDH